MTIINLDNLTSKNPGFSKKKVGLCDQFRKQTWIPAVTGLHFCFVFIGTLKWVLSHVHITMLMFNDTRVVYWATLNNLSHLSQCKYNIIFLYMIIATLKWVTLLSYPVKFPKKNLTQPCVQVIFSSQILGFLMSHEHIMKIFRYLHQLVGGQHYPSWRQMILIASWWFATR